MRGRGKFAGGHVVPALETHAKTADLPFLSAVASAPFLNISTAVAVIDQFSAADLDTAGACQLQQQTFVSVLAMDLATQDAFLDLAECVGADLVPVPDQLQASGIVQAFGLIEGAMSEKADFAGFHADWASSPKMWAFLIAKDISKDPAYHPTKPRLIQQGTTDPFVFKPLQTPFANGLIPAGAPVTDTVYGRDHHATLLP